MKTSVQAFISYSHHDEQLREGLAPYLAVLEREGLVTAWHDRKIMPGAEWKKEIDDNLERSDLILLLISAYFIQSNYAFATEMGRALEMHDMHKARVVPILVRPTPLDGSLPFERLQMLPRDLKAVTSWKDPAAAWSAITTELRLMVRDMLAAPERQLTGRRVRCDFESLPNETICVFDGTAVIGRSPGCDISVPIAPKSVGKEHARFFYDEKMHKFVIDDLGSRNGTFVDGNRVRMTPLRLGSRVELARELPFTFWYYNNTRQPAGALIYTSGDREIGRYVLAPFRRVGIGTTQHDAIQVPLMADGKALGALELRDELLYYRDAAGDEVRLRDGATIDTRTVKMRVTILA